MTTPELRDAEQQMLMARPWHAAEPNSIWEITGEYPERRGTFTECLAMVLPAFVTGTDEPVFKFLGAMSVGDDPYGLVGPAQITHAAPLLLVHRDEPGTAYWADDQDWLRGAS